MERKSWILRIIKIAVPVIMLSLIIWEGQKQIAEIDIANVLIRVKTLSPDQLLLIIFLGLIAIATMSLYDLLLSSQLNMNIPLSKMFKISWMANTFNNMLGFGGFTGAGLRGMFYKAYFSDTGKLMAAVIWMTPLMLTGLSLLAWLPILHLVNIQPILEMHIWLKYAIWGIAAYLPGYIIFWLYSHRKQPDKIPFTPKAGSFFGMILVSLVEWSLALAAMYGIAEVLGTGISFPHLAAIFIAAAIAGVISMVPGGIGSFDLIMLIGMELYGAAASDVLIVLIFYRISYYLIPWILGLMLASTELVSYTQGALKNTKWEKAFKTWRRYSGVPEQLLINISHWALAALVFLSGALLLLSAATPGMLGRLRFAENLLSEPFLHLSHQLSVGAGIALLILSRSVLHKVKRAYTLTLIVLLAGALFTFSKGLDYEEALFLLAISAILWFSRKRFYRETYPFSWGSIAILLMTLGTLLFYVLFGYLKQPFLHKRIPAELKDLLVMKPDELLFSSIIGIIIAVLFLTVGSRLLTVKSKESALIDTEKVEAFLKKYRGNVLTHLVFLQDKDIFWTKDEEVMMMYKRAGSKLVVLGDPIGNPEKIGKAIEEFQIYADEFGFSPIFYQIEKQYFPLYHENGYQFFKLGEEAYVNLPEFTLSGKKKASLRAVKNKFEREEYTFSIIEPPFSDALMAELKHVSDDWLDGKSEKGYSLGFFDKDYFERAPIALLRGPDGSLAAFATLMPVYDEKETLSIDLMRHVKDAPNGTMDYILISLMLHGQETGYRRFNLGMAPLSNVGRTKYAFLGERIASKIFVHGQFFYQFSGIRKYKEKYADEWEPKYLAIRGKSSLPVTMLQLSLMIGKKRKNS
ncbi:bifunctional lysylphosphatidylglycerol flippase/synthetase MprF [Metabacillus sp. GX 13764]|uniref:bifunctional lysylphosphatidylglycerol flippase/synthetase MprF n=1 Tax=Metabacillus kandeliae TaxID=2900151 RepID=UPI001E30E529|nr:bifunctional lysylphosphatidylglycerol flippase/synthetase MprF [Metabacillus kandeliae]MCD7033997.1 bifunctional lysylphosphatidylglycerol flippase/synthetase MprF [Metabacillus kandeliae]